MLRQVGLIRTLQRSYIKRKYLTKDIFLKKYFDLADVHAGQPHKFKVQEEYFLYTMKLEDPVVLV